MQKETVPVCKCLNMPFIVYVLNLCNTIYNIKDFLKIVTILLNNNKIYNIICDLVFARQSSCVLKWVYLYVPILIMFDFYNTDTHHFFQTYIWSVQSSTHPTIPENLLVCKLWAISLSAMVSKTVRPCIKTRSSYI